MRRALRWIAGGLAAAAILLAAALLLVDTGPGHRFVAERIGAVRTSNGLRFAVGRIDGSLYRDARLHDVRVYDLDGLLFRAPTVRLDWRPWRWLANGLDVRRLEIPQVTLFHTPRTRPGRRDGPVLPGFDIRIDRLAVDRLVLARPVLGRARAGRLAGRVDIRAGRALLDLDALVEGSDRVRLRLDAEPDRDRFDLGATARGTADGVLARLVGFGLPVALEVQGDGRWARWRGRAQGRVGAVDAFDLRLAADEGRYRLDGALTPAPLWTGKKQRLTAPRVAVAGEGVLARRVLEGRLRLRSAALAVQATGELDLAASAWRRLQLRAQLLRPAALFPNMSGRAIELRAILDGPIRTARFDYRINAARFAFDRTGFEDAFAAGAGRLGGAPVLVPVRFRAARVTGVGAVAGGILRNLSVTGVLRVTPRLATGDGLRFSSDRLTGRASLVVDLRTGKFDVGLSGALGRYLIPGIGLVDVRSTLNVVPNPQGRGTRVLGRGTAQVLRLDNAFFRSLAGGLPRIETGLERTPDGILHFRNLTLTAPSIRLAGNGYRRRDGTFHFEGGGTQASYGPVRLVLDGRIGRPTLDLRFPLLNRTLGLRDVTARLDPTATGFALRAAGGSRLGPFTANGAILLPPGAQASVAVTALDVAGTRASGRLAIVPGGFLGELGVAGGGWDGMIGLRPVGAIQQVEARLSAANARLPDGATVRRGRLDLTTLLDPAGARVVAQMSGTGLARGNLRLARFAGSARLVGGAGEVRGSASGTRGRAFDLRTVVQVAPGRYVVDGEGTLDRRTIRLVEPAIVTSEGGTWTLPRARLAFAGGEAAVGGVLGAAGLRVDASLARMPLAVLDIGYPGLGLGGAASGTLAYRAAPGAAPTGRLDMTVRGLSRAGLVLTSRPIDLGVAAVLDAQRLGVRAVAASGGRTIGRAQALLRPQGSGDLVQRLAAAPLVAQLRYGGPADTLWRLTGIELFDLSGPVSIAADVGGRLNAPQIRGAVQAQGARIESTTTGTVLTEVAASGRFNGSRLQIDRFTGQAGRDGWVTGAGAFDLAAPRGVGMDLRVVAKRAPLIARDDVAATVTGPITFRSDGRGGVISGEVLLDRARYRLGRATAATAAPRINVREINAPPGAQDDDDAPRAPWTLALRARGPGGVLVTGLGLNSEWAANLEIGGEPQNPAIRGRATLVRGDYEFAGREFDLERGVIRFGGETPANPALDIQADANASGLNAAIRVSGTALQPQIAFTSTPALPQDELLSRLLFGTSITNLSAPEALQLAAAVAALQNGDAGLNPINAVRRAAGLDRLRILPADPQTGQGTAVAAGKYVTRRLYAEIVTDGQGYSATRVEFQVTRWLSILSSISTLGRQSGNVRVSRDY